MFALIAAGREVRLRQKCQQLVSSALALYAVLDRRYGITAVLAAAIDLVYRAIAAVSAQIQGQGESHSRGDRPDPFERRSSRDFGF